MIGQTECRSGAHDQWDKGHSRGLPAKPCAGFPFPIGGEAPSITLLPAPLGRWGGAVPPVPAPRCGRRRSRRRRSRRSRPRVPQPGSRLTWGPRAGRSGGADPRRGAEGPRVGDAAMKARAARGPCRRRRSGNGRRGGGAGQLRAGRRRGAGPRRGRGSLRAGGSHCGSGRQVSEGRQVSGAAAGKPRSETGTRVWRRPVRIFARPGLPWRCSLCQEA